ncbi:MAG: arginase family protein, partial [Candidatus Pacearchaeota archaeon]
YKDVCLIVFDAHPDCMKAGKEPSHEEWLRALIEADFPAENIMVVGMRNIDPIEAEFLKEKKIKQIKMNDVLLNLEDVTDTIMEFASGKKLYLSIDIDFIDPAFAPSTGYVEPGGASSRQALYIFSRLSLLKNLKALDIVEVDSENDKNKLTIKLAAKILAEFL